jgi:hypothetical protein
MTLFILDTGIAGLYLDRKHGAFERAETGHPMQQIDIQIAAIVFSLGHCI